MKKVFQNAGFSGLLVLFGLCLCGCIVVHREPPETSQPGRMTGLPPAPPHLRRDLNGVDEIPGEPEILRKARMALNSQRYREAIAYYREVEKSYREYAEKAAGTIADCYLYLDDVKQAMQEYRRAFKKYRSQRALMMLEEVEVRVN